MEQLERDEERDGFVGGHPRSWLGAPCLGKASRAEVIIASQAILVVVLLIVASRFAISFAS
jgi:hypothetical protein